jgi:integration host factor subunit alpha
VAVRTAFSINEAAVQMTKADIARIVYERHGGISNREAARLVEIIFDAIKNRLGDGEKVQITGFGTFVVRQKRERRGRNPQTGEEMLIKPRKSVVFRPSKLFGSAAHE